MNQSTLTPFEIQKSLATGGWNPNIYLTNVSVAEFQQPDDFVAYKVFPIVLVQLPTSKFYKFSKADLARSTMAEKPTFGTVSPTQWASDTDDYCVKVYQGIWGVDQISGLTYQRSGALGAANPMIGKAKVAAEQTKLFMDIMFAQKFFKAGVWANEYAGKTSNISGNQFYQFDNANSDPVSFIHGLIRDMKKGGRRKANKLSLGANTFTALMNNEAIKERVKYGGTTTNPATVNEKVLAELFGVDEVLVLESTYNKAAQGQAENMDYICDANGALLTYTPNSAAIDEPSAGYIFTWDMLGNGQPMAVTNFLGQPGTHSEFVEALCSFDMKQVSKDLAVYLSDCTSK
jgi:hypothetical protein